MHFNNTLPLSASCRARDPLALQRVLSSNSKFTAGKAKAPTSQKTRINLWGQFTCIRSFFLLRKVAEHIGMLRMLGPQKASLLPQHCLLIAASPLMSLSINFLSYNKGWQYPPQKSLWD